jgi:hypothetical protein
VNVEGKLLLFRQITCGVFRISESELRRAEGSPEKLKALFAEKAKLIAMAEAAKALDISSVA